MEKVKHAAVAGKFYNKDKDTLLSELNNFAQKNRQDYNYHTRAIIVPHAGYMYSGQIASEGFQYLDRNAKNIFIIAPAHYVAVNDVALLNCEKYATPLGEISINQEINQELIDKFDCKYIDLAFENEHAVEVQIPFIQRIYQDVNIIPILVNSSDYREIIGIINYYWRNPENVFVISSDLSHFYPYSDAEKLDKYTAEMIELQDIEKFNPQQACNSLGVCAAVGFAKQKNYSLIRVDMKNSGDITGDLNSVVGYGSWMLYEGEKSEFIKRYFSDITLEICKKSILSGLNKKELMTAKDFDNLPQVFMEFGACFVTLEKAGELRGCIGSIIAHQPLIDDLIKNAHNSAFSDPRFEPLTLEEFEDLTISISLLTTPSKMDFKDEEDLLKQIVPIVDGIIIKDGQHQAVYLPSVWEQLQDKVLFLDSLKIKAGMPPKHFSKTFEAYRFRTEYITNKK